MYLAGLGTPALLNIYSALPKLGSMWPGGGHKSKQTSPNFLTEAPIKAEEFMYEVLHFISKIRVEVVFPHTPCSYYTVHLATPMCQVSCYLPPLQGDIQLFPCWQGTAGSQSSTQPQQQTSQQPGVGGVGGLWKVLKCTCITKRLPAPHLLSRRTSGVQGVKYDSPQRSVTDLRVDWRALLTAGECGHISPELTTEYSSLMASGHGHAVGMKTAGHIFLFAIMPDLLYFVMGFPFYGSE